MSIVRRSLAVAVLGAVALPASAFAVRAQEVEVVNGPESPVNTKIIGTPSVSLAGTPSVALSGTPSVNVANRPVVQIDPSANVVRLQGPAAPAAPQPFQTLLSFETTAEQPSFCHTVRPPADTIITVEALTATVAPGDHASFRISYLPGTNNGRRFIRTLADSGSALNGEHAPLALQLNDTITLQACLESTIDAPRRGDLIVTGTQQPAPTAG